jgi:integral membrane protein
VDLKTTSALNRLRLVSAIEAVSFLLLLVGSVLKRTTDFNPVPVIGALHGVLVIVFLVMLADAWNRARWAVTRPLILVVLSVIPFGGFYAERMLRNEVRDGVIAARAEREENPVEA